MSQESFLAYEPIYKKTHNIVKYVISIGAKKHHSVHLNILLKHFESFWLYIFAHAF